jgi:hypothetical protein
VRPQPSETIGWRATSYVVVLGKLALSEMIRSHDLGTTELPFESYVVSIRQPTLKVS